MVDGGGDGETSARRGDDGEGRKSALHRRRDGIDWGEFIGFIDDEDVEKVKCLHAQIADALVRGRGKNAVGALALDALVERGVAVDGTETCWRRCAPKKGGRGDVEE